ncbi:hypothetical protein [Malikia granosa]|uniref:hypothetical protein n=1 Tax=Malikia granosa TaxID=263067 RepID=UPI0011AFF870|nr:hypothetical protein [Malikia granosa]
MHYTTIEGEGWRLGLPISATGTATTSEDLVVFERQRIANKRSIKENIKESMRQVPAQLTH